MIEALGQRPQRSLSRPATELNFEVLHEVSVAYKDDELRSWETPTPLDSVSISVILLLYIILTTFWIMNALTRRGDPVEGRTASSPSLSEGFHWFVEAGETKAQRPSTASSHRF